MKFTFDSENYEVILGLQNNKHSIKLEGEKQDILLYLSSSEYETANDANPETLEVLIDGWLEEGRGEIIPFINDTHDEERQPLACRMEREFQRREYLADEE